MLTRAHSTTASDGNGSDLPADSSTPAVLTLGTAVEGDIQSASDSDWYSVQLTAGQVYYFMVNGSGSSSLADPGISLYGPNIFGELTASLGTEHGNGPDGSAWISIAATITGKYYVSASGFAGAQGHYTVKAAQMPADQITGWEDTTASATVGQAVDGLAQGINDRDWYGIDLVAGTTYAITLQGKEQGDIAALNYGTLALNRRTDGNLWQLGSAEFGGIGGSGPATFFYTAAASGRYFVAVGSKTSNNNNNVPYEHAHGGGYSVSVVPAAPDIDAGGPVAATVGTAVSSILAGSTDTDTFVFNLVAGSSYTFAFSGPSSNTLSIAGFSNTGDDAQNGPNVFSSGRTAQVSFTASTTGAYNLVVSGGTRTFDYTVLSEVIPVDLPADATTSQTLMLGQRFHGYIDASQDSDWYAVTLSAGQTYLFDSTNATLALLTADGTVLPTTNISPYPYFPYSLIYTSAVNQTVYLAASDNAYGYYRDYHITASVLNDPAGSTPETAARVTVGQSVTGAIDYSTDSDWYAVDVVAGNTYSLTLTSIGGAPAPTSLVLASPTYIDVPLRSNATSSGYQVRFEATATGTFYVHTGNNFSNTGYTLNAAVIDTVASTPATRAVLTVGQAVEGNIYTPDGSVFNGFVAPESDWYAVELTAGQSYVFDVQGSGVSPVNAVVTLRDIDGNPMGGQPTTAPSSRVQISAPTSGVYYVAVTGADTVGGNYVLSASTTTDIFDQINTGATLVPGIAGHSTIESATDADWFRVQLTAGQSYVFQATPDGALIEGVGGLANASIALIDATGQTIASSDRGPGTADASLRWTVPSSGTYFVAVRGQDGATGGYAVTATAVAPQSPVTAIQAGTPVSGNIVRVYFAASGESFAGHVATASWVTADANAIITAATSAWSAVANVTFVKATSADQADAVMVLDATTTNITPLPNGAGPRIVAMPSGFTASDVLNGGTLGYALFLQASGFAMGLTHPDGWSPTHEPLGPIQGATPYGDFGLNQGIFTVMYSDAVWAFPQSGATVGFPRTPMALDIAAAQALYGAAAPANAGDTTYTLPNSTATAGYRAILDSSGSDTIAVSGSAASRIDLRPATLLNAVGGGGYVSYSAGMPGGFTIAAGVTIENATGGSGGDTLIGNAADNALTGNGGDDFLWGGLGNDRLDGGAGLNDFADFALARQGVTVDFNLASAQNTGEGMDTFVGIEAFSGSAFDDTVTVSATTTQAFGGEGKDTLVFTGNFADYSLSLVQGSGTISRAGTTLQFYGFETLKFADKTVGVANYPNGSSPQVSGDRFALIAGGDTYVLTTQDLNATDPDGDAVTYYADAIHSGEILVNGVVSTSFTPAQVAAGQVSFHYVYEPFQNPYAPSFSVIASDGTNGNVYTFNLSRVTGQVLNDTDLDQVVSGTAERDVIYGNGGDDTLGGNAGDRLYGGSGNDMLIGGDEGTYDGGDGHDTLSLAGYSYGVLADLIEGKVNTPYVPNAISIESLIGTAFNDILLGTAGDNLLNGSGGADDLTGRAGNDSYYVDNLLDKVRENADEGHDTVFAAISWDLTEIKFVEDVTLTGTAAINATGNYLSNRLTGNSGDNRLDGGAGGDIMAGGAGNDTYIVDHRFDVAVEADGSGSDTVITSLDHTLGLNVEILILGGTSALKATGNAQANTLIGNAAANVLMGMGGDDRLNGMAGADKMYGGLGNDTYVVESLADRIFESNNQGIDTVETGMSYALTGLYVENLTVSGTGNFAVGGNGFANVLIGNSGNNTINGGLNGDTMSGAAGNDLYFVDHIGDVVIELTNEGKDAVNASITYTLTDNVETLALIGYQAINGTGNALDNTVTGNGNANQLNGGDGKDLLIGQGGNDILTGGAGADSFRFYRAGALNGLDHLTDFVSGTDKLQLTGADYGFAKGQVLTAAQVHTGGSVGAFGQFLYNIVNHTLYWDADGTGATAAVALAVFDNAATPVAGDFVFL